MGKVKLTAGVDYVMGHLRYGHMEAVVDEKDVAGLSPDELKEHLRDVGELVVDDYSIEDFGELENVTVEGLNGTA